MPARTEVIFLDAAGTLITVAEPVGLTYARIAGEAGLSVDAAAMDHAFRCTWKELPPPLHPEGSPPTDDDRSWWRELVKLSFEKVLDGPVEPRVFDVLFPRLYGHYATAGAWRLYDDVVPALGELQGRMRLFVLSNFDRRLHGILQGLGIAQFFEGVIVSSEVGAGKPHARMFEAGLRAAQVAAGSCVHVGDEERADILGAQAVGIPALKVQRPGFTLLDAAERILASRHKECTH